MATTTQTTENDVKAQITLSAGNSCFSMGPNTHSVPMAMHRANRQKLVSRLSDIPNGVVFLAGAKETTRDATDHEPIIRQESYFQYLFGVMEADCYGAIHVGSGKSILFIPRLPQEYAIWMGEIKPRQNFLARYEVDEVHYVDEITTVLGDLNPETVLLLQGLNTDSGKTCEPAKLPEGISTALNRVLDQLRPGVSWLEMHKEAERGF